MLNNDLEKSWVLYGKLKIDILRKEKLIHILETILGSITLILLLFFLNRLPEYLYYKNTIHPFAYFNKLGFLEKQYLSANIIIMITSAITARLRYKIVSLIPSKFEMAAINPNDISVKIYRVIQRSWVCSSDLCYWILFDISFIELIGIGLKILDKSYLISFRFIFIALLFNTILHVGWWRISITPILRQR